MIFNHYTSIIRKYLLLRVNQFFFHLFPSVSFGGSPNMLTESLALKISKQPFKADAGDHPVMK
jgi:hypothetical protein